MRWFKLFHSEIFVSWYFTVIGHLRCVQKVQYGKLVSKGYQDACICPWPSDYEFNLITWFKGHIKIEPKAYTNILYMLN